MNIKKNDLVKIITGKDSGKTGKILNVDSGKQTVLVDGLNLYKKHVRPKKQGEKGQLISVPRPLDISNVLFICGSCGAATRIGHKTENKIKNRYCKKCSATI